MTRIRFGVLALVAALAAFAPMTAQARWAPGGSYQRTCRHIDFDRGVLTATCQRRDGSWRHAWLNDARRCDDNIVNDDGELRCGGRDGHGGDRFDPSDEAPRGTYRDSCKQIRMDGDTLRATCQMEDERWRGTHLDNAFDCDGSIVNFDGALYCGRDSRRR